jgi:hypothetical protein
MKQYRALAALITSKKGLEHPRIRVFATLYGLSSHAGEEGQGYKAEYVDFFFQQILPNVFASAKQVNAILGAKGHSDIDLDKFLKRMENIFPNFLKKDGFKYMVRGLGGEGGGRWREGVNVKCIGTNRRRRPSLLTKTHPTLLHP